MKTTAEKNFDKTSKKFYEWAAKARTAATDYLRETLERVAGKEIEFDMDYDDEYLTITYDGGNHPEYAGNLCSLVYSVYIKNGDIHLKIEDSEEYDIDRVNDIDLLAVCEVVQSSWLPRHIGTASLFE